MSNEKFTPGPWALSKCIDDCNRHLSGYKWVRFASVIVKVIGDDDEAHYSEQGEANARLIAASPSLFALLQRAVKDEPGDNWKTEAAAEIVRINGGAQ